MGLIVSIGLDRVTWWGNQRQLGMFGDEEDWT